jgi:hypothetical protein
MALIDPRGGRGQTSSVLGFYFLGSPESFSEYQSIDPIVALALRLYVALATLLCCNSNIEVPDERNPGSAVP